MIDQSLQYYNGDLLGFVPQPKRQERDRTLHQIAMTTPAAGIALYQPSYIGDTYGKLR